MTVIFSFLSIGWVVKSNIISMSHEKRCVGIFECWLSFTLSSAPGQFVAVFRGILITASHEGMIYVSRIDGSTNVELDRLVSSSLARYTF